MPIMHKKVQSLLHVASWVTLGLAWVFLAVLIFWTVYPYRGLYNVPAVLPIEHKTVAPGTLQSYSISYCVDEKLPLPITVSREIEVQTDGGFVFPIAPPVTYLITQRCETRKMSFGISSYVPAGTYHLHYITGIQVNPIRVIRQSFISENFTVVLAK